MLKSPQIVLLSAGIVLLLPGWIEGTPREIGEVTQSLNTLKALEKRWSLVGMIQCESLSCTGSTNDAYTSASIAMFCRISRLPTFYRIHQ